MSEFSQHYAPFSLHEAEVAFYFADSQGRTGSRVFLSGCMENLRFAHSFDEIRLDRPGETNGNIHHKGEQHAIQCGSFWVMQKTTRQMSYVQKNQLYVLVIRWFDEERSIWAKLTFYGAKSSGQDLSVQDEMMFQDLNFTAFFRVPESGLSEKPDMNPAELASVRYVTAEEAIELYRYSFQTNLFQPIDPSLLAGRAEIQQGSGFWALLFNDVEALRIDLEDEESLLRAKSFTATGGTFPDGAAYPRVEFWVGARRIACVTAAGELVVSSMQEAESDPGLPDDFELKVDNQWAASLAKTGIQAMAFADDL